MTNKEVREVVAENPQNTGPLALGCGATACSSLVRVSRGVRIHANQLCQKYVLLYRATEESEVKRQGDVLEKRPVFSVWYQSKYQSLRDSTVLAKSANIHFVYIRDRLILDESHKEEAREAGGVAAVWKLQD